jgi:hypothetical protein
MAGRWRTSVDQSPAAGIVARSRLATGRTNVQGAHELLQAEMQRADDLGMDHEHAAALATALAVLMRSVALELRMRRRLALRREQRALDRMPAPADDQQH